MNIQMHATDIELTSAIEDYATKKAGNLAKVLQGAPDATYVRVELGRDIGRHKTGEVFKTDLNVDAFGGVFRTSSLGENLYATIDEAVDEMLRVIKKAKGKKTALWKRGASALKQMIRGWRS